MLKKLFSVIILLCCCTAVAMAQEINCKVKVLHEKIQGVDNQVFTSMERSINEFINTRKWTNDPFNPNEKIDCNIMFNLVKKVGEDVYEATMNISASRPVFNSGYTSPTINFIDRDVKFKYSQYTPLEFNDNRVTGNDVMASNLTAVIAYYIYMIIAFDYDSFEKNGGTDYFKRAQNIVNNAPEAKEITGWKAVEGNKNRYWIVDQVLSPRFKYFREFWYTMHREALDNMYAKPAESEKMIIDGLPKLSQLQKENPGSILIQFFFNAKSDELASLVAQTPREQRAGTVLLLQQMDVPNAQKYNALK